MLRGSAVNAVEVPPGVDVSDPAADAPCKIIEGIKPRFPLRMRNEGISHGVARVLLHVNAEGRLVDSLITAYTRRPFVDEAVRAIESWKFEPARSKGERVSTIVDVTFDFDVNKVLLVQKFPTDEPPAAKLLPDYEYQACSLKNLDRLPVPVDVDPPVYPEAWLARGITGSVDVDFYIDETGRARLPVAVPGADEMLASIAVTAVQKWHFTPPKSHGKPVLAHARQTFIFGQEKTL